MKICRTLILIVSLGILAEGWSQPGLYAAFTDVSASAGVMVSRPSRGNPIWADINGDGLWDVVVINHASNMAVYRNNGDGTFTDIKDAAGIFEGEYRDRHGAAWGDCDNDGDPDLYITQGNRRGQVAGLKHDELYRNNGAGQFTDIGTTSGTDNACCAGHSVNWLDFDKDGQLDLFVKNNQEQFQLYRNIGDCQFVNASTTSGLPINALPGSYVSWGDYNMDGWPDLLVLGDEDRLFRNNGDGTFTDVTSATGLNLSGGRGSAWGDYDNDGDLDLYMSRGRVDAKNSLDWNASRIVFSDIIRWFDVNGNTDGFHFTTTGDEVTFDLFWDTIRRKKLVFLGAAKTEPSAKLPFTLRSDQALGKPSITPGVDRGYFIWWENGVWHIQWTRPTRVRTTDLFTPSETLPSVVLPLMAHGTDEHVEETENLYRLLPPHMFRSTGQNPVVRAVMSLPYTPDAHGRSSLWPVIPAAGVGDTASYMAGTITANGPITQVTPTFKPKQFEAPNTLYRNNGDGTFTEVATAAGVANIGSDRGAVWGDYDNDGDLDLYVVNYGNLLGKGPNKLYRNNGDGTFTDVAAAEGVEGVVPGRGDGAAWEDYNNDGFLDLFVTNSFGLVIDKGPQLLFRNNGNDNKWLKLKLVGTVSNRDALGAMVMIQTGGKSQYRLMNGAGGGELQTQGHGPVHFGIGTAMGVDQVQVLWPSGLSQPVANIGPNQMVTLVEGQSIVSGTPTFQSGTDAGYFIWKDAAGNWQIHWSSDGVERQFEGTMTSDGDFTAVTPIGFENSDQVNWHAGAITFTAAAKAGSDGLQFQTTGNKVTFDVKLDGTSMPTTVHLGQNRVKPATLPVTVE